MITVYTSNVNKKLQIICGDVTLGVKGDGFHYIFSYQTGGAESFFAAGREWLYRTPRPVFWRALTDNDRGSKFHIKSGIWMSADMFISCVDFKVCVDGNEIPKPLRPENNKYGAQEYADDIAVSFCYETITAPKTHIWVTYHVEREGCIHVKAEYQGQKGLPELPVFGMRFIMPAKADGFCYAGLSGETYPDRMAGAVHGVYEIEDLPVTPYLVPQDCGVHMETEWVKVYRSTVLDNSFAGKKAGKRQSSMIIEAKNEKFAFSCLPYTAEELENATHQEELPPGRRTVLCVYGAVRGVGGIDSWGANVESPYRIDAEKDICMTFKVRFE